MKFVLVLVAIAAGVGTALESGSNSALQKALHNPLLTVALVASVTFVISAVLAATLAGPFPPLSQLGQAPWWVWLGGAFGALVVFATVYVSPALGAGAFIATIVTSSTLTSLVLDNYGLMEFEVHRASIGRIIGAVLMVAGVACVAAF